ncbi:hypothetical protein [Lacipirellula limnantheis]|uniref:Uncharacterized protein n=1 Tax=Lacipirellula limnantheis TaxID=2528024 RepID=A0A517TY98_9BACT|nr:hypothetical protein [Lacipirellula limnantheis]QDT73349.1 hypothetical protein I41_25380 [Lacipirellula limnantheis]
MVRFGHKWGKFLDPASGRSFDERLGAQYYDAEWVFYQIADYTGDKEPWYTYANHAEKVYRDEYLATNKFGAQGFRRFAQGLYEDLRKGGDTTLEHLELIREKPAYSQIEGLTRGPTKRSGFSEALSREVAYALESNVIAEKAGLPRAVEEDGKPRAQWLLEMVENHLWEWRTQDFEGSSQGRVAPFMMGLSGYALAEYQDWEVANGRDPNSLWPKRHWPSIDAALLDVFAWLHDEATVIPGEALAGERMWVPLERLGHGTFRLMDRTLSGSGSPTPAPDLNQLIAPTYFWLYKETGDQKFRSIGDDLFAAGARYGSAEWSGKHFNQQYRLSFRSLKWREEGNQIKPTERAPTNQSIK